MFWMREICLGLKEILEKTFYMPVLPIELKNIFITDDGIKF